MRDAEPTEYLAERLREAIATDAGIHELGIVVHVTGPKILLSGSASSPAQRESIRELVERLAPEHEVVNEVDVASAEPPHGVEQL